jgi:hypothetical protein
MLRLHHVFPYDAENSWPITAKRIAIRGTKPLPGCLSEKTAKSLISAERREVFGWHFRGRLASRRSMRRWTIVRWSCPNAASAASSGHIAY